MSDLKAFLAQLPGRRDEAVSILNGCVGDSLEDSDSSLSIPMSFRLLDRSEPLDFHKLDAQLVNPSGHICLLVHGVMANEALWKFPEDGSRDYGSLLAKDCGLTPIYVRYNSGLHISINGERLAALLNEMVAQWPVEVEEISIIGHSMGGLVARSACYYGRNLGWLEKLSRLVLLGAPSTGAPLEKLAHIASFTLKTIINPWTRLISKTLELRSAGIKDLRYGSLRHEDWQGQDLAKLLPSQRHPVPLVSSADHYVAVGSLWKDIGHPLAKVFGDAMVTQFSAEGHELLSNRPGPFFAGEYPGLCQS